MDFLLASSFSATTGQHMNAGLTSNFNVYLSSDAVLWKQGCCIFVGSVPAFSNKQFFIR